MMDTVPCLGFYGISMCNLRRRPFRSACLAALAAIISFVLCGGSILAYGLTKGADSLSKRLGADIMIVPSGYESAASGILLRSEPSAFYIDPEWVDKVSSVEGVAAASPQFFVTSLNAGCCSVPVQLVGYDPKSDFIIGPWVATYLPGSIHGSDIVVGSAINAKVGDRLKFFEREYTVVARLDRTGMGFDSSVFMTIDAARIAAGDFVRLGGRFPARADSVSSIFLRVSEGYAAENVVKEIQKKYGYGNSGIALVPTRRFIDNVASGLNTLVFFIAALESIIWIMAALVLAIVFSMMVNERKREFGILRSIGATRTKLAALVLAESGLICFYGGVLGTFLAGLIVLPFRIYIGSVLRMPYVQAPVDKLAFIFLASLLLSFVIGPAAALIPTVKAVKSDVYSAIKEGEL
jgi:putative ABC transport system permease protein